MDEETFNSQMRNGYVPFLVGLINQDKNSFINSILQCLFHILELPVIFLHKQLVPLYWDGEATAITRGFARILAENYSNIISKKCLSRFLESVKISAQFAKSLEHDAYEFLIFLLKSLEAELFRKEELIDYAKSRRCIDMNKCKIALESAQSFLSQCWLKYDQKLICERGHVYVTKKNHEIMTVEIVNKQTIEQCIENYYADETLAGCICNSEACQCNAHYCTECKKHVGAILLKTKLQLPNILIIQLRLFTRDNGKAKNSSDSVFNYSETIQIFNNDYELFAVCIHQGESLENGHYISVCKNSSDNLWRIYREKMASNPLNDIISILHTLGDVYILFYRRIHSNREKRNHKELEMRASIEEYEKAILEGPLYNCVSCDCMFFRRSVTEFKKSDFFEDRVKGTINYQEYCISEFKTDNKLWHCAYCAKYARSGEMPPLWLGYGLEFPKLDSRILALNAVEERLCAPQIPFVRIKPLKWNKQQRLNGNVVNVLKNMETDVQQLPRNSNELKTINLIFETHDNAYQEDMIRYHVLNAALNILEQSDIYKSLRVKISKKKMLEYDGVKNPSFRSKKMEEGDEDYVSVVDNTEKINNLWEKDCLEENEKTCANSHSETAYDHLQLYDTMLESVFSMPPSEECFLLSEPYEKYAEEGAFLKIFGGNHMLNKISSNVSMQLRCKSFFRRRDRRCAEDTNYIFFMYKQLVRYQLTNAFKKALKCEHSELGYLDLNKTIQKLRPIDEIEAILTTIKSSSCYWDNKRNNLFAMIRQLGAPSFFGSLNPAEIDWDELVLVLAKILIHPASTVEMVRNMSKEERIDLVSRDPVTTTRYLENRLRHLFLYIVDPISGPFVENSVEDFYWSVGVQEGGALHIDYFLWCKNRPQYNFLDKPSSCENIKCIDFIDKYVTCSVDYDDAEYEALSRNLYHQRHRHCPNCQIIIKKTDYNSSPLCSDVTNTGMQCKYGFPWPILDETLILEPLLRTTPEQEKNYQKASLCYKQIVKPELDRMRKEQETNKLEEPLPNLIRLPEFLKILQIGRTEYIDAIRSYITRITVFMKRTSRDIMINPFNKLILARHRANMDIQYIYNSHAAEFNVSTHMLKSNTVISKTLNTAIDQIKKGNKTIRQSLKSLKTVFQNCTEVSVQECVYHLLCLSSSKASRKIQVIPDRNLANIGILDYYVARPNSMKDVCLAEFASWYEIITNSQYNMLTNPHTLYPDSIEKADDDKMDSIIENKFDRFMNEHHMDDGDCEENKHDTLEIQKLRKVKKNANNILALKNGMGYVRRELKAKVLDCRWNYSNKDHNESIREHLLLYMPWYDQQKEINNIDQNRKFQDHRYIITLNRAKFEIVCSNESNAIERATRAIHELNKDKAEIEPPKLASVFLKSETEHDILEKQDNMLKEYDLPIEDLVTRVESKTIKASSSDYLEPQQLQHENSYANLMCKLNKRQHRFLLNALHKIKTREQFFYFVGGCSGTGKSRLIKALNETCNRYLMWYDHNMREKVKTTIENGECNNEQTVKTKVLIAAYTEEAAAQIDGINLDSAFALPKNLNKGKPLPPLSIDSKIRLRKMYKNLRLIIIDEISMVDFFFFQRIEQRLKQIFDSNELFGGLPVVVFGDFCKLEPEGYSWIFADMSESPNVYHMLLPYQTNGLWDNFQLFELTEIMRQKDEIEFAETLRILGEIGVIGLSKRQIEMLDSRIVKDIKKNIPRSAFYLFQNNGDVDNFNEDKINRMPGTLFKNEAIDKISVTNEAEQKLPILIRSLDKEHLHCLLNEILLKHEVKYMVIRNISISDGIGIGKCGILKHIQFNENHTQAVRLFFDFMEDHVGASTRKMYFENHKSLKPPGPGSNLIDPRWTPLELSLSELKFNYEGHDWSTERLQFHLTPAEAVTISKIQGATCPAVAIDLSKPLSQADIYIAMSRVKNLENLFLFGKSSILQGNPSLNWSKQTQQEQIDYLYKTNKVLLEMERLRKKSPFKDEWNVLMEQNESMEKSLSKKGLSFYYHHINGLKEKLNFIKADYGCVASDVLIFTGCNITEYESLDISGFTLVKKPVPNKLDVAIYIRDEYVKKEMCKHLRDNSKISNLCDIGLIVFKLKDELVNFCYLSNKQANVKIFLQQLKSFLNEKTLEKGKNNIFVIGTFNLDALSKQEDVLNVQNYLNKKFKLTHFQNGVTHDREQMLDWCLSNSKTSKFKYSATIYETYYSEHKPLIINFN